MEAFKLISMTDFVLEKEKRARERGWYNGELGPIYEYAKFLKQPLTLGMFVPCGDDGNIIHSDGKGFLTSQEQYQQAKEKVLFKGDWELKMINTDEWLFKNNQECFPAILFLSPPSLEYLANLSLDLELTETGIKQIK